MIQYTVVYKRTEFEYCKADGKFYKVNLINPKVSESTFEELLVDYMGVANSTLKKFLMIYIRLCMKTIGIDLEEISDYQDLDAIIEIYFKEGLEMDYES